MLTPSPFFDELVLQCPRPAAELREALVGRGVIAGAELGRDYPDLADCLLLCCTELTTQAQIEQLATALSDLGGR